MDSVKNKFTVGFAPLLYFAPTTDIPYLEFQPTNKISFELGGGVYNSNLHSSRSSNNAIKSGFTVRSGIKIFLDGGKIDDLGNAYWEVLGFYRQLQYINRLYNESSDTDPVFEQDYFSLGGDPKHAKYGDE